MGNADVTVNLDKVDTNILMVNLNGSRIKPVQLYDMLLKVSADVQDIYFVREKPFRRSCAAMGPKHVVH